MTEGAVAFDDLLAEYRDRLSRNHTIKQRSRDYREECIKRIIKSWPQLPGTDVRRIVALMGSMLSRAQEELIVQTAGPDGRVILMFDEDVAGLKGRAEAKERLSRHLTVDVIRFEAEGTQPDSPPAERLQALLR